MQYFPGNYISSYFEGVFSDIFSKLNLESIFDKRIDTNNQIYRFYYSRAFHDTIVVLIEIIEKDYGLLNLKRYNIGRYFDENEIVIESNVKLYPSNIYDLLSVVEKYDFWNIPAKSPRTHGLDGSTWIVEGLKDGKFHIIERWSPIGKDDVSVGIGLKMLGLSRVKVDMIY